MAEETDNYRDLYADSLRQIELRDEEIRILKQQNEFMGRQLSFMIPKVRIDEQIQLDEIEIGRLVRWHTQMTEKCVAEKLYDRARYHRDRAIALRAVVAQMEENGDVAS